MKQEQIADETVLQTPSQKNAELVHIISQELVEGKSPDMCRPYHRETDRGLSVLQLREATVEVAPITSTCHRSFRPRLGIFLCLTPRGSRGSCAERIVDVPVYQHQERQFTPQVLGVAEQVVDTSVRSHHEAIVEVVQLAPLEAPAPAVTNAASAPVTEYAAPAPAASNTGLALVTGYVATAPVASHETPAPVEYVPVALTTTLKVPAPEIGDVAPASLASQLPGSLTWQVMRKSWRRYSMRSRTSEFGFRVRVRQQTSFAG